ncbi:MAG TPA: hypothetical protein VMW76_09020 [Bacteroidales bacterium]|nr:hypothetical protein [Bacteroidales bacterium]
MKKEKMTDSEMEFLLGFKPNRAMKIEILKTARETGKTVREVVLAHSMPPIILVKDGEAMPEPDGRRKVILTSGGKTTEP